MVRNRLATEMEEARKKGGGIRPGAHPEFEGGPKARKPKAIEAQIAARKEENKALRKRRRSG